MTYADIYRDDCLRLRREIPALHLYTLSEISKLYSDYSDERYCASWMMLDDWQVRDFESWLKDRLKNDEKD